MKRLSDGTTEFDDSDKLRKDVWDKLKAITHFLAFVIIPISLSFFGYFYNLSLQKNDANLKLVELATEILKSDPDVTSRQPHVRDWAIDIINAKSDVKMPEEAKEELRSSPILLSDARYLVLVSSPSMQDQIDNVLITNLNTGENFTINLPIGHIYNLYTNSPNFLIQWSDNYGCNSLVVELYDASRKYINSVVVGKNTDAECNLQIGLPPDE